MNILSKGNYDNRFVVLLGLQEPKVGFKLYLLFNTEKGVAESLALA